MKRVILSALMLSIMSGLVSAQWTTSGSDVYFTGGNVGISHSAPLTNLHVRSATSTSITWPLWVENPYNTETITGYGVGLKLKLSHNGELNKWAGLAVIQESTWANNTGLALYANEAERVRIKANGNMGIKTTNPTTTLEVYTTATNSGSGIDISQGSDGSNRNSGRLYFSNKGELSNSFAMVKTGDSFSIRSDANPNSYTGTVRLTVRNNGNVGIGTSSPSELLEVNGITESKAFRSSSDNADYNHFMRNGTGAAVYINQVSTDTSFPILRLSSGTATPNSNVRFTVEHNGNVGIGTTTPGNKLEVNGVIRSKEVIVEATSWPDYVFHPEYELISLEEIEAHIKEKGHLPEVPSAKEVEEEGQHLGEMQQLLLKKIEELTLHVIELKKQNDVQQKENEVLKERVEKLESTKDEN